MRNLLQKTEGLADSASLFLANVAAVILLGLVALTCVDVIGRYVFSSPLVGAVELVRLCMAGLIFFSFPLMFLRNDHIIVDLFAIFQRGWIGWISSVLILCVTIYVAYKIGDRVFDYAVRAAEDNDMTEYLSIPRWPVVGLITVSIFAAALTSALRLALILSTPGKLPDDRHGENQ
ncbi:MAG: TRAP transporter small permease [Sedimentitalea sp.]